LPRFLCDYRARATFFPADSIVAEIASARSCWKNGFASSWMKCHHPDVFCAAILNAPMGFVGKGTGLGLPMVHGMAEQSGGKLILKTLGQGTTADICLPVAFSEPEAGSKEIKEADRACIRRRDARL
jgi:hypothetical protein